jgi:hypothetical protein
LSCRLFFFAASLEDGRGARLFDLVEPSFQLAVARVTPVFGFDLPFRVPVAGAGPPFDVNWATVCRALNASSKLR